MAEYCVIRHVFHTLLLHVSEVTEIFAMLLTLCSGARLHHFQNHLSTSHSLISLALLFIRSSKTAQEGTQHTFSVLPNAFNFASAGILLMNLCNVTFPNKSR